MAGASRDSPRSWSLPIGRQQKVGSKTDAWDWQSSIATWRTRPGFLVAALKTSVGGYQGYFAGAPRNSPSKWSPLRGRRQAQSMELVASRNGHPISRFRTASAASAVQASLGGTLSRIPNWFGTRKEAASSAIKSQGRNLAPSAAGPFLYEILTPNN